MLYGLYLSASGVMANSHKQDVISNNLANSETTGFKRDLALFMERVPESQAGTRAGNRSDPLLDRIGGGLFVAPSATDTSAGELETTDGPLDVAVMGNGYFHVQRGGQNYLTRDGKLMADREGNLIQSATGARVLDVDGKPIVVNPGVKVTISNDGSVVQNGEPIGKLGLREVTDIRQLMKVGGNLFQVAGNATKAADLEVRSGMLERANVDPARELAALMDTQRELEANANMIRYQDQTLGRLVNEVGKIG